MSDLPSAPCGPTSPFSPGDPSLPGSPSTPIHVHAHAKKYCDDFRAFYKPIVSSFCINSATLLEGRNNYEYTQGKKKE